MRSRELVAWGTAGAALCGTLILGAQDRGAAQEDGAAGPSTSRTSLTSLTSVSPAQERGAVTVVQAVPGLEMTVAVDGESAGGVLVARAAMGLPSLVPGTHEVEFEFEGGSVAATIEVVAGRSIDVVVHRPAEVGGDPIVSIYPAPTDPIAPGKARVLLAHTATTAPADVAVDGEVVFTNIANGEYAEAEVAAGSHRVALLPSGVSAPPILGPLDVPLRSSTLTSIYAVGNPRTRSMDVIVREIRLSSDGSEAPTRLNTGSVGLVTARSMRMPTSAH